MEYSFTKCKYQKIHPSIELKRVYLLKKIRNYFYDVIKKKTKTLKKKIISSIFSRWYFSQFINGKCFQDPLIVSPISIATVKDDIEYQQKNGFTTVKVSNEFYNNFFRKLKTKCDSSIREIKKIKKLDKYQITQVTDDNIITLSLHINNKSYDVAIEKRVYLKLKLKYNSKDYELNTLLWCLINRYTVLKIYNLQLAVHPDLYKKIHEELGVNFELFASSINHYYDNYCSLFYDIEKYFGSKGSFFGMKLYSGFYSFNPPFDELLMVKAVEHIIKQLKNTKKELAFFITIPVWDKASMLKLKLKYIPKHVPKYKALDKLKQSGMIRYHKIYKRENFPYFDYVTSEVKHVANTHVIILANYKLKKSIQDSL
jgi:hypothetical protein